LEKILIDDQAVRDEDLSYEILVKYGKNSVQYLEYVQKQIKQDSINLTLVESFLRTYGYPTAKELGSKAAITPWIVIHHAPTYEDRERNFRFIWDGYKNGDLDDGKMYFYLSRMYEIKNKTRFVMKRPYKSGEEVLELVSVLGLTIE
jgi:hypothetical protein